MVQRQPVLSIAAIMAATMANAQTYPSKAVRLIVPFAPGGSTDIVARMLAPRLSEHLGQQVVVDNRGGGASTIGMDMVAKAAPDGHTLGVATLTFALNPSLFSKLPYNTERDFAFVSLVSTVPFVTAVHPSVPARTVKQLIALAKARPGTLNYSSSGNASTGHMAMELIQHMTGTTMVHVPYTGGGPALLALLSGQVSIFTMSIPAGLAHFKSGKLIPLGVTSARRDATLPDVPSIAEAGLAGYEIIEYQGIVGPAAIPRPTITRLNGDIVKSLAAPDLKERFITNGAYIVGSTPEEMSEFVRKQMATWGKVIKSAGIKLD